MFSIWIIEVPTHIKSVSKLIHMPNLNIIEPVPKQHVESICVLAIN
jgi:hypothetical protein